MNGINRLPGTVAAAQVAGKPPAAEPPSGRMLLTAREAAKALAISEKTLWLATVPRGSLPCVRVGSRGVRYDPADLRAWIARQKVEGRA